MTDGVQQVPHDHAVTFYEHDLEVVAEVARFVATGLANGERVVVVATAQHRDALDDVLVQYGVGTARARLSGRYLTLDAAETLTKFMVAGVPDAVKFEATIGAVIDADFEDGCQVRVFGEMVALLWDDGNVAGAIELESLWNGLAAATRFTLLCAYPTSALVAASLNDASRVCELHSAVMPPRSYATRSVGGAEVAGAVQRSDVFIPVPSAIPVARRFTASVLRSWGEDSLVPNAVLITSELATNAVEHAASPFRVHLRRADSVIRLSIEDVGPAQPQLHAPTSDDFNGRGVAIVSKLAKRWGCDVLANGKDVWAELRCQQAVV